MRLLFQRFRSGKFYKTIHNKLRGRLEAKVDNDELKAIVEDDLSQIIPELRELRC